MLCVIQEQMSFHVVASSVSSSFSYYCTYHLQRREGRYAFNHLIPEDHFANKKTLHCTKQMEGRQEIIIRNIPRKKWQTLTLVMPTNVMDCQQRFTDTWNSNIIPYIKGLLKDLYLNISDYRNLTDQYINYYKIDLLY